MITLKQTAVWIAAAILCLGIGTVGTAEDVYVYDFDNGQVTGSPDPGTPLTGQDNWYDPFGTGRDVHVRSDLTGYAGIDGLAASWSGECAFGSRVNNGDFSYSIPAATTFRLEFNLLAAPTVAGDEAVFGLAVDSQGDGRIDGDPDVVKSEKGFVFGYCGNNCEWFIREAAHSKEGQHFSSSGGTRGETYRVVLDVDPTANGGDGLGDLSVQLLSSGGGTLTPVDDLQDVPLGILDMVDPDPSHWDAIYIRFTGGSAADNLTITVGGSPPQKIPGDANNDGIVNDQDASILAAHWQNTGATWADGDFNNDQIVNDQDASILAAHWQETREGAAAVPEPGMGILLIGGALALLVFRQRRKRSS